MRSSASSSNFASGSPYLRILSIAPNLLVLIRKSSSPNFARLKVSIQGELTSTTNRAFACVWMLRTNEPRLSSHRRRTCNPAAVHPGRVIASKAAGLRWLARDLSERHARGASDLKRRVALRLLQSRAHLRIVCVLRERERGRRTH